MVTHNFQDCTDLAWRLFSICMCDTIKSMFKIVLLIDYLALELLLERGLQSTFEGINPDLNRLHHRLMID